MAGHRMGYLTVLLGAAAFYIASGEWISWLLLLLCLGLPWLSLLVSLGAIRRFRAEPAGLDIVETGEETELWLLGSCPVPMPPFRGKLSLRWCITGERRRYRSEKDLPTDHCGGVTVTAEKVRVCDYLGLFSFRVRNVSPKTMIIRPKPQAPGVIPSIRDIRPKRWTPKPGGGFAENHELRLYRPGDSLNQIHWKLTAKTGKWILREPMEPVRGRMLLTMTLRGTPEALDRKFGRLLWLGGYLLDQEVGFEIRALTGDGLLTFPVKERNELYKAVDTLLCTPAAGEGSIREYAFDASWQYHIGGEADET